MLWGSARSPRPGDFEAHVPVANAWGATGIRTGGMLRRIHLLGERLPPEEDPPTACSLREGWRVYPIGLRKISDNSKLEAMNSPIGSQRHVESLKTEVEEQVEGVLGVLAFSSAF